MIKLKGLPENNNTKRRSTKEYKRFDRDTPLGQWVMPENFQFDEINGQSGSKSYRIGYKVRPWRDVFYIPGIIISIMCLILYFKTGGRHHRVYDMDEVVAIIRYFSSGAAVAAIISYFAFTSLYLDVGIHEFKIGYGMRLPWMFPKTIIRDQSTRVEVTENEKNDIFETISTILNGRTNRVFRIYYVRNDQRVFLMKVKSEKEVSTYQSFFEELIHVGL